MSITISLSLFIWLIILYAILSISLLIALIKLFDKNAYLENRINRMIQIFVEKSNEISKIDGFNTYIEDINFKSIYFSMTSMIDEIINQIY